MTADHAAIRARLDAATQGPWTWAAHTTADGDEWAVFNESNWALATSRDGWVCDAELIAHAPTDLRALLDENAQLRQALDYYEKCYPCDGGCEYYAAERECSRHGLLPTELWQGLSEVMDQRDALAATIAAVRAALDGSET